MPLSLGDIKQKLPYGAQTEIAAQLGCTPGHVSEVVRGLRTDRRVAKRVARRLGVRLADLPRECYEVRPAGNAGDSGAAA